MAKIKTLTRPCGFPWDLPFSLWPPQHLHAATFQHQSWSLIKKIIHEKETLFWKQTFLFLYHGKQALLPRNNVIFFCDLETRTEWKKIVATTAALSCCRQQLQTQRPNHAHLLDVQKSNPSQQVHKTQMCPQLGVSWYIDNNCDIKTEKLIWL